MPSYTRSVQIPGKSAQELYDKVASDIDRFLSSIGKCDITRDPAKRTIFAKHTLFTATITCFDGSIQLDASLSLLAAPFRSKLDSGIDKWLEKSFKA